MTKAHKKTDTNSIWLYHFPDTRAVRARWMLEELALPYVLAHVDLRQAAHKGEDYLQIHPLGKVPALQIDGTILFESLAICLYLADQNLRCGLAPSPQDAQKRAVYYTWMAFSMGTLEPAIIEQVRAQKAAEQKITPIDLGPMLTPFETAAHHVEQTLSNQSFLLGDQFTAADLMNGSLMMWAQGIGLHEKHPHTLDWIERLKSRPAYQRAKQA